MGWHKSLPDNRYRPFEKRLCFGMVALIAIVLCQIVKAVRYRQSRWAERLLTTRGAKSGQERVYPLMAVAYRDHYLAVASKGGAPKHPLWYYNLLAHPDITIEVGHETVTATARLLTGEERDRAFARAVAVFPPYGEYQKKTARHIPVFLLERRANG